MKISRLLSGIGAVAVAMAPVAAQAGTRAADTGVVSVQPVKMSTVSRASATAEKKSELAGGSATIIAILAAAAVIVGIIIAVDDDDDVSPGA